MVIRGVPCILIDVSSKPRTDGIEAIPVKERTGEGDPAKARTIVAESLEADALLALSPEHLAARLDQPISDWGLVVASGLLFELAEVGRNTPDAAPVDVETVRRAAFAALVRNDPTDIWVYNSLTFIGEDLGLPRLGAEAARRGLALLDAHRDPENVR